MNINFKNFITEYMKNINQESNCLKEKLIIDNIFNNKFMKKYTKFKTFNSFTDSILHLPNSDKYSFKKNLDIFISTYTKFSSWDNMFLEAIYGYLESFFSNWVLTFK